MTIKRLLYALLLPMLFFAVQANAQDKTVTGRVTDSSGTPISNASVTVRGSKAGTQTGNDGTFTIKVPSTASRVSISSVGYAPQEVSIGGGSVMVSLKSANASLSEVVVIGYGTARKKDLTGSVTAVTAKDFNKGSIVTPEQLIMGKVAGVQINTNGGAPGSGSTIRIRGGASLNASNEPLIVIDGVPLATNRNSDGTSSIAGSPDPLSLINPNDIESFNILKDASATAIYGSRASNGVIIIVTKKGRGGKARFNFSTQNTIATLPKKADVLTADEFKTYVNTHGTGVQKTLLGTGNTDWQNEVYDNSFSSDNYLSVSGSVKNKLPYRVSLGFLNQDGLLKTGNLKRTSGSVSLNPVLLNNHLKIDLSLKGSISKSRFADEGAIGSAVRFDPTKSVKSGNNRFGGYYEWLDPGSITGLRKLAPLNPLGLLEQKEDKSDVKRSIGNIQFDYKFHFLPELRLNVNLGYDIANGQGTNVLPDSAASVYRRSPDAKHGGQNNKYLQKKSNTLLETYLNYTKDIKSIDSRIDATVGYSYQKFITKNFYAEQDANGVLYLQADGKRLDTVVTNGTRWNPYGDYTTDGFLIKGPGNAFDYPENRLISFFGRLNYSYKGKYLLTATFRRDASTKFSEKNWIGWFPSGAFAWRIKEEDFLKNVNAISDLKVRVGYGKTGQQDGIGLYDYLARYSFSTPQAQYQFGNTYYPMSRPSGYNPNLKWEETSTYNIGLDYGFLNNRISGTLDFYLKKTKDLLSEVDQPAGTNFSNKSTANVGSMENRGVELAINAQIIRKRNFSWDLGFNATYNKNKITQLTFVNDPKSPGNLTGGIAGGVNSTIQVNSIDYAKQSFYVYQQVYDQNGRPIEGLFEDRNRDGIINQDDLYRYKFPDPEVFLGAYTNVSWKKWDAGISLRANFGNYLYNNRFSNTGVQRNIIDPLGFLANGSRNVLETNFTGNGDKYLLSDYYVENASFLRMDNLNLGYSAGNIVAKGTDLRIGVTMQNVFTITKYRGIDPKCQVALIIIFIQDHGISYLV